MDNHKKTKKTTTKKTTRYTGDTKMAKENKEALKIIRSIKGKFG